VEKRGEIKKKGGIPSYTKKTHLLMLRKKNNHGGGEYMNTVKKGRKKNLRENKVGHKNFGLSRGGKGKS